MELAQESPRHSLAEVLELVSPHVDPALASGEAVRLALSALRDVDATTSRCVYLECALAPGNGTADVAFRVRSPWRAPGNSSLQVAQWVERDLAAARSQHGDLIESKLIDFVDSSRDEESDEANTRAIWNTVRCFLGSSAISATWDRVMAAFPSDARLVYVGDMRKRASPVVRLCIGNVDGEELLQALRQLRWPGSVESARTAMAMAAHARQPRPAVVHLDLNSSLAPTLGLEYPLSRQPQLAGTIAESQFLDQLMQAGLCDLGKRKGLEHFAGVEIRPLPHECWPSILVRRVNHLKLTVGETGQVSAKAYLCLEVFARSRRSTRHSIQ